MKRKKEKNSTKLPLTTADIARLGPAARAKLEAALGKSDGASKAVRSARWFKVTWYSPKFQRRVGAPNPIEAQNKSGAIAEMKVAVGYADLKRRKLPLPTNFIATEVRQTNPKRVSSSPRQTRRAHRSRPAAKSPRGAAKKNPPMRLTAQQLAHLRKEFAQLDNVDVTKHRAKFYEVFAGVRTPLLKQLADSDIEWVSHLAKNAYMRRLRNPKKNPMHALEVGSHVAMILGGLETVRRIIGGKKRQRKKSTRANPKGGPSVKELTDHARILYLEGLRAQRDGNVKRATSLYRRAANLLARIKKPKLSTKVMMDQARRRSSQKNLGLIDLVENLQAADYLSKLAKGKKKKRRQNAVKATKPNPNTGKIFEQFTGQRSKFVETGFLAPGPAPANVDQLGKLTRLHLSNPGFDLSKCGKQWPCKCGHLLTFRSNPAKLCATQNGDGRRRFVIGLRRRFEMPPQLNPKVPHDYGEVHCIEYEAPKPHLYGLRNGRVVPGRGYKGVIPFYHILGEEGGRRPHLILQNGLLKLVGGDYKIEREGIRD